MQGKFCPALVFYHEASFTQFSGFLHQSVLFTAFLFSILCLSFQFCLNIQLPSHSVLWAAYQEIYFELKQCEYTVFIFGVICANICRTIYVKRTVLSATSVFYMIEFKLILRSLCLIFQAISFLSVVSNIWKLLI